MQNDAYRLSINLGKKKENNVGSIFLKWAVTRGRLIVITIELLALGALGYRFFIDQQIVDLNDQIKKQQIFIQAQAQKERNYRNLQTRIMAVEEISSATATKIDFLRELFSDAENASFVSSSFALTENTISVDGQASSIFSLNSFIDRVKKDPNVASISLDELSTLDQGIRFRLIIQLKGTETII